jgi:outer membrane protein
MRNSWFILLLFFISAASAEEPPRQRLELSLKRAVQIALSSEGSAQLQLSGEALKQASARSAQSRAALLPTIDSSLTYRNQTTNLSANGLNDIGANSPFPFAFPSLVGPFNVMDARISASQSIFDFSSIRRFQASKAGVSAAKEELSATEEQVAGQVARAYLLAIRTDADMEVVQANVNLSQALLTQAENQKKAGAATGIEITRARVQLANDRQRLLVVQNARRSAHLRLLRAINSPLDVELELTDKLSYVPVDFATLDKAKEKALAVRQDLKAQMLKENVASLSSSAAKSERLPSLSAFGDYGDLGSGVNNSIPTRAYGLTLRVPLFDGGRRDAHRVEAASAYRAEKTRTVDLRQQIALEVSLSLDSLHSADEQVNVAREGLQLSENELAQARRRYDAGVAGGIEVTDAQTRLERARDNLTEALYNYNLARIDLEQAMGNVKSSVQ